MHGLLALLLVGVSVGLSNMAGAIAIGLSGVDARLRLRVGLAFGFFEALMPLAGLVLGRAVAGPAGTAGRYLGAGLLVATGAYTIWQGRRPGEPGASRGLGSRGLLITAAALSLDNMVVGFALGVHQANLLLAAGVIGAVSLALSLLGLELGSRLGRRAGQWGEEIGGGILVLVGIALGTGILR